MKKASFCLVAILVFLCVGITNSCSQPVESSAQSFFGATTPCNEEVKKILGIPADTECEMMKWNLTLYPDSKKITPTSFNLVCVYGIPKQGTRGFMEGAKTIELKGKCSREKGIPGNTKAVVYNLTANNSSITLSFLQPSENLLHLLNKDKQLMIGTAAWSYTLNRTNPIPDSRKKFILKVITPEQISTDSDTVAIFEGRTPCNAALLEINDISANGCQIIKCQLVLLQDVNTHSPATFILRTVYVGKGDTKYSVTGKWKLMRGVANDQAAIVYQLETDSNKPKTPILLLKADNNILFFLDNDTSFLVGNEYCSFTLNRAKK